MAGVSPRAVPELVGLSAVIAAFQLVTSERQSHPVVDQTTVLDLNACSQSMTAQLAYEKICQQAGPVLNLPAGSGLAP